MIMTQNLPLAPHRFHPCVVKTERRRPCSYTHAKAVMEFIHPPELELRSLEPMHDNNGLIHWKECNHGPEGEKEAQILKKRGQRREE
jgi:hypothetical protein